MAVFDTTFLVDLTRSHRNPNRQRARSIFSDLVRRNEAACTTRLNVAEAWVGIELSGRPQAAVQTLGALLDQLVIIDFDDHSARRFGQVEAYLRRIGRPVGEIDTLVVSICLVHNQRLITRNSKHFANLPGLVVESY